MSLVILQDGSLASSSADKTIKVWNPESGKLIKTLKQEFKVPCLALFQKNSLASCAKSDLNLWDLKKNIITKSLSGPSGVYSLLTLEENKLLGACSDGKIRIWTDFKRKFSRKEQWEFWYRYPLDDSIVVFSEVLGSNQPIAVLKDGKIASCKENEINIFKSK